MKKSGILYPAGGMHRCISLCGLSDRQLYAGKAQERRGAEGCRQYVYIPDLSTDEEPEGEPEQVYVDFAALEGVNSDIVAWLYGRTRA